jgi:hypothetical protein
MKTTSIRPSSEYTPSREIQLMQAIKDGRKWQKNDAFFHDLATFFQSAPLTLSDSYLIQ